MKPKDKLKKKLHEFIDRIDDEAILNTLAEQITPYITKNTGKKNVVQDRSDEFQRKLDAAIAEANNGKTVSQKQFRKALDRWLTQ